MSRARDIANYGDGIDTSSITSGTFADARIASSNVTQHEGSIDALASNPTITLGSNATFPSGMVTNVFAYNTTGTEYANATQTLKAMQTSNSFSGISGKKYYITTTFNSWGYKDTSSADNWIGEFYLYTGTTSRSQGTTTFTGDTDQGKHRIGHYFSATTNTMNAYQSVSLQGSFTASSTTTYYFTIIGKSLGGHSTTRMQAADNHPWRTLVFEIQP